MKKKTMIHILGLCALLASCSQDDTTAGTTGGAAEETVTVAFTAQVDYSMAEAGSGTEAAAQHTGTRVAGTGDEMPKRYYAQAISQDGSEKTGVVEGTDNGNGSCTFRLQLQPGTEYDYLFWADNAEGEDAPADLTAVAYSMGTTAFACHTSGTPAGGSQNSVKLTHVVTKVSVKTTAAITGGIAVEISTQSGTGYNVKTETATAFAEGSSRAETAGDVEADEVVLTTYLLPGADNRTVTIGANGRSWTLNDVPLAPNTHVVLKGDLSGKTEASHGGFQVGDNVDW